ncbi:BadF/BadG/BcrA/BcrD ATPase family protein [Phaeovulum sp. W22_SRMD_FR3]|uniref:BadF/BadG/BcrA/BcrD ATPase family protein n=1 Tax=Phaeovulum sp. W22_SRMD_FR3 TaxID=3240274 RepID=UPI003F9C5704
MYYLGIDGGGSGCRACLTDATGRPLGQAEAGPANIASHPAGAQENLTRVAQAALSGHCPPHEVCAVFGVAGANIPGAAEATHAALSAALPFARLAVVSDVSTALTGALGMRDGILAALGTGSVFASQRAGRVRQIGGWGFLLGDEGSGAWMGRLALMQALRALDGHTPQTPLLQRLLHDFQGGAGIVEFARHAAPAAIAALVPQICAAHAEDDPAAGKILMAAAAEVSTSIGLLQTGPVPLPVVLTGGLAPIFPALLKETWQILPSQGSALDGAVAQARALAGG